MIGIRVKGHCDQWIFGPETNSKQSKPAGFTPAGLFYNTNQPSYFFFGNTFASLFRFGIINAAVSSKPYI
jgi:hypothetical protein